MIFMTGIACLFLAVVFMLLSFYITGRCSPKANLIYDIIIGIAFVGLVVATIATEPTIC